MTVDRDKNLFKSLVVPRDLDASIHEFRLSHRLLSDSEAYRFLLRRGLEAEAAEQAKAPKDARTKRRARSGLGN